MTTHWLLAGGIAYRPVRRLNSIHASRLTLHDDAAILAGRNSLRPHLVTEPKLPNHHFSPLPVRFTEFHRVRQPSAAGHPAPVGDGKFLPLGIATRTPTTDWTRLFVGRLSNPPFVAEFRLQFGFGIEPILKAGAGRAPASLPFETGTPRDRLVRGSDAAGRGNELASNRTAAGRHDRSMFGSLHDHPPRRNLGTGRPPAPRAGPGPLPLRSPWPPGPTRTPARRSGREAPTCYRRPPVVPRK
jgi:hypothetical protein